MNDVNMIPFGKGDFARILDPGTSEFVVMDSLSDPKCLLEALKTHHVILRHHTPSASFEDAIRALGYPMSKEMLAKGLIILLLPA